MGGRSYAQPCSAHHCGRKQPCCGRPLTARLLPSGLRLPEPRSGCSRCQENPTAAAGGLGAAGCEGRREAGNRVPCLRVGKSWPSSSRHPAQPKSHRGSQAFRQFLPSPSSAPGPFSVLPYRLVLSVHSPPEGPRCPGNPRGHGQGKSAPKQSPFIFVASSFVTFNWKQVSNTQARVLAGNAPQSI